MVVVGLEEYSAVKVQYQLVVAIASLELLKMMLSLMYDSSLFLIFDMVSLEWFNIVSVIMIVVLVN